MFLALGQTVEKTVITPMILYSSKTKISCYKQKKINLLEKNKFTVNWLLKLLLRFQAKKSSCHHSKITDINIRILAILLTLPVFVWMEIRDRTKSKLGKVHVTDISCNIESAIIATPAMSIIPPYSEAIESISLILQVLLPSNFRNLLHIWTFYSDCFWPFLC